MTYRATTPLLVQTPNVARIRELMGQALDNPTGLEVRFTLDRYGTLERCKERAVSLQNQVSSIRARARTSRQLAAGRKNVAETGEQLTGPYDGLVCSKRLLPNNEGYVILLGPATAVEDDFEVFDRATGQRVAQDDPRTKRRDWLLQVVVEHSFAPGWKGTNPLTPEQERELHDLDRELFTNLYADLGLTLPVWAKGIADPTTQDADLDLVDAPMEDFGVDTGEGEL